ncbi:porin [Rhizobium glycinendophyticum]|uniref:Porin n=1 Tax=Rhizobium glycinendophyticum TaxID=2589807 RepID=A0A504UIA6_9HYPH|nr:porin [Rhizobium glycinendophyticum]TPP10505.1 porin [Rhizobium glycinendophyticum]
MNIKSLLLGSAAALAVVSGAQAADAIVAAEPEPMEYVRVCDAFGTGYFYIPGTETCLQISGWVRFQVDFGDGAHSLSGDDWDSRAAAYIGVSAKSDTELGTLTSFIGLESDISIDGEAQGFYADEAYLSLGGFKAGWFYNWWDTGIAGETDGLGNVTEFVSAAYTYTSDAFTAGLSIDEVNDDSAFDHNVGVSGTIGGTFGAVSVNVVGGYDFDAEEGAVRAIGSADVGPGTFYLAGVYASGESVYFDAAEWSVAASYALKASDKLTVTPGVQYWSDTNFDGAGSPDMWKYGITVDYKPVENLLARVSVQYDDVSEDVSGYFRLQRAF